MSFAEKIGITRDVQALDPDIVFSIFGFPIASSTLMSLLITAILLVIGLVCVRKFSPDKPSKFQIIIEMLYDSVHSLMGQIAGNKARTAIIFPVLGAMMVYLTFTNIIGLVPGLTELSFGGTPIFRAPSADFSTTFALALGSILVLQWVSIKEWGVFTHFGKYFKFKELVQGFRKGIGPGMMAFIDFFVGILDVFGEIAKIVSLSLRLFGNMYAGNVLAVIIMGALAYVLPAVWLGMNLFVGVLQAMVFASLVGAYYTLSINPDKDEEVAAKQQKDIEAVLPS